jgi:hypothetical protein
VAFPTVESITESSFASQGTSHNVSMPATVDAGDLLLMYFTAGSGSGSATFGGASGWTQLYLVNGGSNKAGTLYAKDADGTEGGTTVAVTISDAREACAQVYRISGWGGTLGTDVDVGTAVNQGTTTPDPPSVTAGWGSDDNLFIAVCHVGDDGEVGTAAPTNYSSLTSTTAGGSTNNDASTISARRELAASSDDPGTFTIDQTGACGINTTVVKPGAAPPASGPSMLPLLGVG